MQHHMESHPMAHIPEMEAHSATSMRPRKMSTTGGNRSWSEEEENYLLQTRMQKMPYKHIAAHLKKTELACRLHYHQLSHGSHRRRRNSSISSSVSSGSNGQSPAQYMLSHDDDYSMASRHGSPMSYTAGSPIVRPSLMASPGRGQHKILLPKPRTLSPSQSPEPHNALRINTSDNVIHPQHQPVDTERLRAIYEARRAEFWASIAAEYGSNVSAEQLEQLWQRGSPINVGARPPTPDASPDGSVLSYPTLKPSVFPYPSSSAVEPQIKSFSPINQMSAISNPDRMPYTLPTPTPSTLSKTWNATPTSNVPIASLLTEDKHPRGQ